MELKYYCYGGGLEDRIHDNWFFNERIIVKIIRTCT